MQALMRYQLERDIESASVSNRTWLKERFIEVLESDKEVSRKCDYFGYSILGIDARVQSSEEEISKLKVLKDKLKTGKEIALEVGAELFSEYGIEKLEGAGISSISVYAPLLHPRLFLHVEQPKPLMEAGFVKHVVDVDAIKEAYLRGEYKELIESYCSIALTENTSPKRLRINQRRSKVSADTSSLDIGEVA